MSDPTLSDLLPLARDVRADLACGEQTWGTAIALHALDIGLRSQSNYLPTALHFARSVFQRSVEAGGDGAEQIARIDAAIGPKVDVTAEAVRTACEARLQLADASGEVFARAAAWLNGWTPDYRTWADPGPAAGYDIPRDVRCAIGAWQMAQRDGVEPVEAVRAMLVASLEQGRAA